MPIILKDSASETPKSPDYLIDQNPAEELEQEEITSLEQHLKVLNADVVLDDGRVELEGQVEVGVEGVADLDQPPQPEVAVVGAVRQRGAAPHLLQPLGPALPEHAHQLVLKAVAKGKAVPESGHILMAHRNCGWHQYYFWRADNTFCESTFVFLVQIT